MRPLWWLAILPFVILLWFAPGRFHEFVGSVKLLFHSARPEFSTNERPLGSASETPLEPSQQ